MSPKSFILTAVFATVAAAGVAGVAGHISSLKAEGERERTSKQFYLNETRSHAAAVSHLLQQGYKEIATEQSRFYPDDPSYTTLPANNGGWWDQKAGLRGYEFTFKARKTPADEVSTVMVGCTLPDNSTEFSTVDVTCATRLQPRN
jgi:hypothetical protein